MLQAKQKDVAAMLAQMEGGVSGDGSPEKVSQLLGEAWKDITKQLEHRKQLLDQSVAFHSSAQLVSVKCYFFNIL